MKRKIMLIASLLGVSVFTPSCSDRAEYEPLAITCTEGECVVNIYFFAHELPLDYPFNLAYSTDNQKTWIEDNYKYEAPIYQMNEKPTFLAELAPLKAGDTIYLKGYNPRGIGSFQQHSNYSIEVESPNNADAKVEMSGEIMSLVSTKQIPTSSCFYDVFSDSTTKIDASKLILPRENLTPGCFMCMFENSNIVKAPKLPATKLADYCYTGMFTGCNALVTAPELPATTLVNGCYAGMFKYCALTTAPKLPATTLVKGCYEGMFCFCDNLSEIKVAFGQGDKWPNEGCTDGWLDGVSHEGTFFWAGSNTPTSFKRDINTVPESWTIEHIE